MKNYPAKIILYGKFEILIRVDDDKIAKLVHGTKLQIDSRCPIQNLAMRSDADYGMIQNLSTSLDSD